MLSGLCLPIANLLTSPSINNAATINSSDQI